MKYDIVCVACGKQFVSYARNTKYCRRPCERKHAVRKCEACGNQFTPEQFEDQSCGNCQERQLGSTDLNPDSNSENTIVLVEALQVLVNRKGLMVSRKDTVPRGWYVYSWTFCNEVLPFYIGKGTGNRGWKAHHGQHCQRALSNNDSSLKVIIHKDYLTEAGATFLEGCLIDVFTNIGAVLTNRVRGAAAEPSLPLEYPD